jgi:hypothetical protein
MVQTTTCKGCGRKVVFAVDEEGAHAVLRRGLADVRVREAPVGSNAVPRCERSRQSYVSHFVTCPQRERFSKKGGA